MTPQQIELVQQSWKSVAPISEKAAELFYGKLFELDPSAKELFKNDMKGQGRKLMQTIGIVVGSLTKLEQIMPTVQDLGHRHVELGVSEEQYDTVGEALLWTLQQGLGEAFTPQVKEAWTLTYSALAKVMTSAAKTTAHAGEGD